MANWVARNSDGAWMVGGFGDPSLIHSQPANYTLVDVPGDTCPNPRTERYDAAAPSKKRAATAAEITAYDEAIADAKADAYYKDKDILAMCGVIEEVTNASWATLTNAQKRSAVVARAVRFNQQRKWVERNYALMGF